MKPDSESLIREGGINPCAAGGNCVAVMRGGEQPEAEEQSRNTTKLNSNRRVASASLLRQGEACRPGDDDDLQTMSKRESASARRERSGNVPQVSCDKWRDPRRELTRGGSQSVHSSEEAGESRGSEGTQEGESVTNARAEEQVPPVSRKETKRGTEIPGIEPRVWTERMQAALVRGVKGNRWFSLIDKVDAAETLALAWERVRSNAGSSGVDGMSIERYCKDCEQGLLSLRERLRASRYQPKPIKRVWIAKEGTREKRPLGIPTVEDRIVQTALRLVIEPLFERDFSVSSYGFRPGRGCKDALRAVEQLLNEGYHHVVDADIKGYFDAIPKERLMRHVAAKVADGKVLSLIRQYLDQGIMTAEGEQPAGENGTPQGAVLSPLLANIYLDPLDKEMEQSGAHPVRYADDFVVLCRSEEEAHAALAAVAQWMKENGLTLHPTKTRIVDASRPGGFDFLGYHFERGRKWPSAKAKKKFKRYIRAHTKRTYGQSLPRVIVELNSYLRGWYEYFKHCRRQQLNEYDGYVRGRLRGILRNRAGGRGRGRGQDHQRWDNRYFSEAGLFSMMQAQLSHCMSS